MAGAEVSRILRSGGWMQADVQCKWRRQDLMRGGKNPGVESETLKRRLGEEQGGLVKGSVVSFPSGVPGAEPDRKRKN